MQTISKHGKRDWTFYNENKEKFNFSGVNLLQIPFDEKGYSACECFYFFDTTGKLTPCREPQLLSTVINCKKSINLHIKMYAEGIAEGSFSFNELFSEFANPPEWVKRAMLNQVERLNKQKGYGSH